MAKYCFRSYSNKSTPILSNGDIIISWLISGSTCGLFPNVWHIVQCDTLSSIWFLKPGQNMKSRAICLGLIILKCDSCNFLGGRPAWVGASGGEATGGEVLPWASPLAAFVHDSGSRFQVRQGAPLVARSYAPLPSGAPCRL